MAMVRRIQTAKNKILTVNWKNNESCYEQQWLTLLLFTKNIKCLLLGNSPDLFDMCIRRF
jgi:hypothetical protein